ncbi:hypothetical protein O181_050505 [Austropuccinia psidii MF-1]|uniref:Uncharacterized protein n=1 Tax=Austropuccinia psidii MF-1 TaxID=1389203 RepID=A0A9Q3HQZ3_9BASI|nr:hypothetical protein [Austropuccinia psidii MF-1]
MTRVSATCFIVDGLRSISRLTTLCVQFFSSSHPNDVPSGRVEVFEFKILNFGNLKTKKIIKFNWRHSARARPRTRDRDCAPDASPMGTGCSSPQYTPLAARWRALAPR